jgi:hypothetical protein
MVPLAVVELHPFKLYETEYVVVEEGVTVKVDPVVFPGVQVYVPPVGFAVAVNVAEAPGQIVLEFTLKEGEAFTVTIAVAGKLAHVPFE